MSLIAFSQLRYLIIFFMEAEIMSHLDWTDGKWEPFGKDLETALQSKEAQLCAE